MLGPVHVLSRAVGQRLGTDRRSPGRGEGRAAVAELFGRPRQRHGAQQLVRGGRRRGVALSGQVDVV